MEKKTLNLRDSGYYSRWNNTAMTLSWQSPEPNQILLVVKQGDKHAIINTAENRLLLLDTTL